MVGQGGPWTGGWRRVRRGELDRLPVDGGGGVGRGVRQCVVGVGAEQGGRGVGGCWARWCDVGAFLGGSRCRTGRSGKGVRPRERRGTAPLCGRMGASASCGLGGLEDGVLSLLEPLRGGWGRGVTCVRHWAVTGGGGGPPALEALAVGHFKKQARHPFSLPDELGA